MESKIPSEVRKLLIQKLKEYRFMNDELILIEEQLDSTPTDKNYYIKSKNKISRKTESLAIRLAENKKYQEIKTWKHCIDDLRIDYLNNHLYSKKNKVGRPKLYDNPELKLKYLDKRYVECTGKKINNEIVFAQLQLEGFDYSIIVFKRMVDSFLYDLYKEAKLRNLIKFE